MKTYLLRIFLILPSLILPLISIGSHLSVNRIEYAYIGDSTGIPFHYRIRVHFINIEPQLQAVSSLVMHHSSSCDSSSTFLVNRVSGPKSLTTSPLICGVNGTQNPKISIYEGFLTLSGPCMDHKFYFHECCRTGNYNNVQNSEGMYLEALLNNMRGDHDSPTLLSEPIAIICPGRTIDWKQKIYANSSDSIFFALTSPKRDPNQDLSFLHGLSATSPFFSTTPITFDGSNSNLGFTPTVIGKSLAAIMVEQYSYDSTYSVWIQSGITTIELSLFVTNNCDPIISLGPIPDTTGFKLDSISGVFGFPMTCGDSTLHLSFNDDVDCSSIDISDFRFLDPNGVPIPIMDITKNCSFGTTDALILKLAYPVTWDGDYQLLIRRGSDGNSIKNPCGFETPSITSIPFFLRGCSNLGTVDHSFQDLRVYPNPTQGILKITWKKRPTSLEYSLRDISGKELKVGILDGTHCILDLTSFDPGNYLLILLDGTEVRTQRIMLF
ncbi:MAG: T9SS type A sorting domain-containing protein [Bacteroidota bacterium]|nr:T9SS type A sorting domain-containing protein [Bacteroidota bacterium]MDX5404756.1 T9SS type A sorting domain-containing protein [Bacteroidota bacterium]MDX5426783.1 T9SS type A sorting domain-containing protein [Bacteroidota bacterium]MDX5448497.1 T9SS type A sorting domain-containing protein [Bacteroidota bacterium]MDX5504771.1 T9SS type A sorting domain-containing protein [Bacteroidota bacterium]